MWVKFWQLAGDFGYHWKNFVISKTEYSYLEESFDISRRILILWEETKIPLQHEFGEKMFVMKNLKVSNEFELASLIKLVQSFIENATMNY